MSTIIDFRSDACTMPTPAMRQAMAEAEVGNDDFGEDPTINRLEKVFADLLGKEDAVFVQSGTMANLSAVMSHLQPGEIALIGSHFHIYDFEGAAMQRVVGCSFQTMEDVTDKGRTKLLYETALDDPPQAPSHPRLLCLENTVSRLGGTLLEPSHQDQITHWARSHGLGVHLDGARIFNAAAGLGIDVRQLTACADTVSVALNKSVGAPVGSAVAGSREIAERMRRHRWMLGGNWKQGGVVAAASLQGLQVIDEVVARDHENARKLAESLNSIPGSWVDLDHVVTNIVFWEITDPSIDVDRLRSTLKEAGFLYGRWKPGSTEGGHRCRLVTHYDINDRDVARFVDVVHKALRNG